VTSEQLRLKAGKVRCGNCQAVFNAFDELQTEADELAVEMPLTEEPIASPEDSPPEAELPAELPETEPEAEEPAAEWDDEWLPESEEEPVVETPEDAPEEFAETTAPAEQLSVEPEPVDVVPDEAARLDEVPVESQDESPEASTQAARQAGLVAARELSDTPAFNRWAAGTLASDGLGGFAGESARRAVWPFVVVAILLLIGLLGQLLYYFRTEIVLRLPDTAALYELAAVDIPLPRNSGLVSIETSDLQSDNARGLFVLQATLKNRAGYAQAWPALELSLTDVNDAVVSRRVMFAVDYLPPGTKSDAFPANGDVAVKLWIEAKEIGASGYRLYIFYP
jgi:hypothetical protein